MQTDSPNNPPCCQTGCPDCPYGYQDKVNPDYPAELQNPWEDDKESKD